MTGVQQELHEGNQNWAQTNEQINDLSNQWEGTNNAINGVSQQWGQTNAILQDVTTPSSLLILASAAGAGFVLGSAIAHLAISIIKAGVKAIFNFLHELITKKKANQKLIEDFEKAMEEYDRTMKAALQLQQVIIQVMSLKKNLNDHNITYTKELVIQSMEELLVIRDTQKQYLTAKNEDFLQQDKIALVLENKKLIRNASKDIEKLEKTLEKIQEDRHNNICKTLEEFYYELITVESKLEDFRIDIMAAQKEWNKRYRLFAKEKRKRINKIIADAYPIYKAGKKEAKVRAKKQLKKDRKTMIAACIKRMESYQYSEEAWKENYQDFSRELLHRNIQERSFDHPPQEGPYFSPPGRWQRLKGSKKYYQQKICESIVEEKLRIQHIDSEPTVNTMVSEKDIIISARDQKISFLKEEYLTKLENAHMLRRRADQDAELFSKSLMPQAK